MYRIWTKASIGWGNLLVLSGYPTTSPIDKQEADMVVLNLVINGRVVSLSGARALDNAFFATTGKRIRRLLIQPEDLRRS